MLSARQVNLSGSTLTGPLQVLGADITGQLICHGAKLTGKDNDGYALLGDLMKAGAGVFIDEGFTADGAFKLADADITGQLSRRGAKLTGKDDHGNALVGDAMKVSGHVLLDEGFAADGAIRLADADIGQLNCRGATLTGQDNNGYALFADGMKAGAGVFLDQKLTADGAISQVFTAAGTVRLVDADIGQLSCRGATLKGKDNGYALVADRVKASDVFLDEGFTADGAIKLAGADIAGQFSCRGAKLNGKADQGNALVGLAMKVRGDVFLDRKLTADGAASQVFSAAGAVRLAGADITGQLSCRGAKLNGKDDHGNALVGDAMKVRGDVFLDKGFAARGAIRLRSVRIGGSVLLRPAKLAAPDQEAPLAGLDQVALDAAGAQVTGSLVWAPASQVVGEVNLEGATVGHLADDWGEGRFGGFWPAGGQLRLDGFTYGRFGGDQQATGEQRLKWIQSQYPSSSPGKSGPFATQPYEQLVKVYRQAGKDDDAREVAIARHADERQHGSLSRHRKVGNWFMDMTIKFGYQTWRAALGLAVVFVAFLVMTFFAQQHHAIVPTSDLVAAVHPPPVTTKCTPSYPCFYPLGYAVDVVIPVINVLQADFWGLSGVGWVVGSWAATVLGWAAVTLLVVGYTGLVRQQ
jgi:hypothetical protein